MIIPALCSTLHPLLTSSLPRLVSLLRSDLPSVRHMSSKCLGEAAAVVTVPVMVSLVNDVTPLLESTSVSVRRGAVECLAAVVDRVDLEVVPYIVLLVVPTLARMSDQVRLRLVMYHRVRARLHYVMEPCDVGHMAV